MPRYTIEIDGHTVTIEARTPDEALATANHWADNRPAANVWQDNMTANAPHAGRPAPYEQSFQGARATGTAGHPVGHIPTPAGLVGSTAMNLIGAAAQAGRRTGESITGRHVAPTRSNNPIVDALIAVPAGAATSTINIANQAINPDAAISDAAQVVARNAPVLAGALRRRSGDQVSADVRAADEARRQTFGPGSSEITAPLADTGTNGYQPSTAAGRMGERVGSAVPYLAAPGAVLPTIAGTAAGELAGAGAHMMGANAEQADTARLAGNVAGGVLASPVVGARPAERVMMRATDNMNVGQRRPAQNGVPAHTAPTTDLDMAVALMRRARNLPNGGINVYGDEALSHVAGPNAGPLQTVVRQATRTGRGGRAASAQIAERPAQIRNATMGTADLIAPPVADPAALATTAQRGAGAALEGVRSDINAQARPFYDALEPQLIPGPEYAAIRANPSYEQAFNDIAADPILSQRLQGVPQNSMAWVNEVLKRMGRNEAADRQGPTNPGGDNTRAGQHSQNIGTVNSVIDGLIANGAIPDDIRMARETVAAGRQNMLEPLVAGPLGDIAGSGRPAAAGVPGQTAALYPSAPPEGQAANTVTALRALEGETPGTGAALTRSHLVDALEQGTRRIQGGDNPRGGANVANRLAGNRAAGETFLAGVGEVAPAAAGTTDDLIRALQATGTRSPEGSPTATDLTGMSDLGAGEAPMETARALAQPHRIPSRIDEFLSRAQVEANAGEVMRVLGLPPDEFQAYMASLPTAAGRARMVGLAKALTAATQDTSNR